MNDGNDSKINVLDFSLDHRLNEWLGATRDSWCRTFGTRTVTFQGQSRIRWCHELEITFHVYCHFDRLYLALSQTHDFGLKIKVLILKTGKLKYTVVLKSDTFFVRPNSQKCVTFTHVTFRHVTFWSDFFGKFLIPKIIILNIREQFQNDVFTRVRNHEKIRARIVNRKKFIAINIVPSWLWLFETQNYNRF